MERPTFVIFSQSLSACEKILELLQRAKARVFTVDSVSDLHQWLNENRGDVFVYMAQHPSPFSEETKRWLENSGFLFWVLFGPSDEVAESEFDITWPFELCNEERTFRVIVENLVQLAWRMKRQKEMASLVLHDLRTPLQNLNSYVELLGQNVFGTLNEGQQKIINNILLQGELVSELLQEITDILRFKRRTFQLPKRKTRLVPILNEVVRSLWGLADRQNIKIQTVYSAQLPEVEINVTAIKRVLFNLILNAIKFSKKNGVIRIQARVSNQHPGQLLVQISDSGPGIPEEHLTRIFNKFYRLDQPQELLKGSGLGLYIARNLIEAHGGRIAAYNNREGGATFYFTLPIAAEKDSTTSV